MRSSATSASMRLTVPRAAPFTPPRRICTICARRRSATGSGFRCSCSMSGRRACTCSMPCITRSRGRMWRPRSNCWFMSIWPAAGWSRCRRICTQGCWRSVRRTPCSPGLPRSGTLWASAGPRADGGQGSRRARNGGKGEAMDFGLNEEQRAVVATVRDFVRRELIPHEDLVERLDAVPDELAKDIRGKALAAGLYAANFPAELGGGGLDAMGLTLAERELGWTAWALQALVARPSNILRASEDDQVEAYLLPTVRGERYDCLAMTEPGAGSDVRSMKTRARRAGGDWVIDGTKHFISYADVADFVVLFAVTGTEQGPRGERSAISAFLVDHGTPGFTVSRGAPSVSHRGYHHCELSFADCQVPSSALLGAEGGGFDLLSEWLGASRLTVAATSVGRARRVLELSTEWAATREQFGQPIGRFQGVGFSLADMATEIEAAELLTLRAAWRLDRGRMSDADAAMAKLYASEMLGRVTDQAVQIFGGMGLMSDFPVERFWRDARAKLYAAEMLGRVTDQAVQICGGMGRMSDYPVERFWRDARVERIWDGP